MASLPDTRVRLDSVGVVERIREKTGRSIRPASWRTYAARGTGPKADGYFGRTPYWYPATVDAFIAASPGQGVGGGRPRKPST